MEMFNEEFSSIYQNYNAKIAKLCLGYTHSVEEAEDLVQDTFLSAWKHWNSFQGHSSRKTWIYRIAINKCLSHIKRKHQRSDAIKEMVEHPHAYNEKNEAINLLYDAINKLEKLDRLLISMYLDELAYREIAEVLGIKENTVAVKIHRIKIQLTEIFNRHEKL
jgi:RNA polymerase sigma factor (sigma-70 family)